MGYARKECLSLPSPIDKMIRKNSMIPEPYLADLNAALASRAEEVCNHLLPGGKRINGHWSCGGVDGGPGRSMDVELVGDTMGVWHDRSTGEAGRLLKLWKENRGLKFTDAVYEAADFCRMQRPEEGDGKIDPSNFKFEEPKAHNEDLPPLPDYKAPVAVATAVIDWARCVSEFTPEKAAELAQWRGYSVEIVQWMKEKELIGCYNGAFAFPVHNAKGHVVAIHYKGSDAWWYYPKGAQTAPFIVGNPSESLYTLAFESQWDAFSVLDKLHAYESENASLYSAYITRSATSNTDISKLAIPSIIAVNQNDPEEKNGKPNVNKEGRTPSHEWLHRIQTSRNKITQFAVFEPPAPHKDANDWIRCDQPDHFEVFKRVIEDAKNPILTSAKTVRELLDYNVADDPDALIGHEKRFLSKGGSWMIIGPSGVGKSTLITSLCIHAAAGMTWHGLTFRRPMKTLVVQAENDEGDLAEMLMGAAKAVRSQFTKAQFVDMGKNLIFQQVTDKIGEAFCKWLEEILRETGAEIVVIDPLLSFVGDDISLQKVASNFFRNLIQPILKRTGAICIMVHHTGKPAKDKGATKGWSDSDFSYMGLGSSELVNWPRAVSVLVGTQEKGTFLLKFTKRGTRAGMIDQFTGCRTTDLYLRHGSEGEGIQWLQTKYEEPEKEEAPQKRSSGHSNNRTSVNHAEIVSIMGSVATYKELFDLIIRAGGVTGNTAKGVIVDMQMAKAIVKGPDNKFRPPEKTLI